MEITGNWQELSNNVLVRFNATTGHTLGNYWFYKVYSTTRIGGRWKLKYLTLAFHNLFVQVSTAPEGV